MKHDREFFNCDCHTEGVILSSDDEQPFEIYLANWTYGQVGQEVSWWQRVKWCCDILRRGLMFTDQTVLDPDEAERLGKAILRRVKEIKKAKKKLERKK